MAKNREVLILGELSHGKLSMSTKELLGGGRDLADSLGYALYLVLIGDALKAAGDESISYGADEVYLAENPRLNYYQADSYLQIIEPAIKNINPEILLMGQTSMGRDLAPRLACRLKTGLAMDCVDLDIVRDSSLMRMTRPVFGCKALAVMTCNTKPQMATVRCGAMKPKDPDGSRKGRIEVIRTDIDESEIKTRVLKRIEEQSLGIPLEEAHTVVCGGRGMGTADSFSILNELAQLLGGAVAATRPPCDAGWIPSTRQIGLTGKIVRPDLYIAVALSGSSQHMAGCSNSRVIVAINKDPEANIFSSAHYGIIGDYRQILPPF
ncbi:MAG: electron transfer flavoprotein subunit alpha/FixB family protein, partial [Dehalococcoidia bacterium]